MRVYILSGDTSVRSGERLRLGSSGLTTTHRSRRVRLFTGAWPKQRPHRAAEPKPRLRARPGRQDDHQTASPHVPWCRHGTVVRWTSRWTGRRVPSYQRDLTEACSRRLFVGRTPVECLINVWDCRTVTLLILVVVDSASRRCHRNQRFITRTWLFYFFKFIYLIQTTRVHMP